MTEVYKMTHNLYDTKTVACLFTLNDKFVTRGHPFKLKKPSFSALSANFYTNRVVNFWNQLPPEVVTAGTLNSFKNHLDKYCEHIMFTTNISIKQHQDIMTLRLSHYL